MGRTVQESPRRYRARNAVRVWLNGCSEAARDALSRRDREALIDVLCEPTETESGFPAVTLAELRRAMDRVREELAEEAKRRGAPVCVRLDTGLPGSGYALDRLREKARAVGAPEPTLEELAEDNRRLAQQLDDIASDLTTAGVPERVPCPSGETWPLSVGERVRVLVEKRDGRIRRVVDNIRAGRDHGLRSALDAPKGEAWDDMLERARRIRKERDALLAKANGLRSYAEDAKHEAWAAEKELACVTKERDELEKAHDALGRQVEQLRQGRDEHFERLRLVRGRLATFDKAFDAWADDMRARPTMEPGEVVRESFANMRAARANLCDTLGGPAR